jgi:hypothetical protein
VGPQVPVEGTIATVNSSCFAIDSAIEGAYDILNGERVNPAGVILLYWNLGPANGSAAPAPGLTTVRKIRRTGNTFYGLLTAPPTQSPIHLPAPLPRPPIRTRPPIF